MLVRKTTCAITWYVKDAARKASNTLTKQRRDHEYRYITRVAHK